MYRRTSPRVPIRQPGQGGPLPSQTFLTRSPELAGLHHDLESRLNAAWLFATLVFILTLALYVGTMCRTVFWWDTGELAANAKVLGIAHRPGFPLYVLAANIFGRAPFGDFFYRVNFLSALTASTALAILAYVWYSLVLTFLRPHRWIGVALPVALTTLALSGTYTLWMQAVRAEVYAPTLLLCALMFGCLWGAERASRSGSSSVPHWLLAVSYLGGLGLGLHNATFASTLPAIFVFVIWLGRRGRFGLRHWVLASLLFILGASVNLYLPVRATADPPLNWGWSPDVPSPGWTAVVGGDALGEVVGTSIVSLSSRMGQSLRLFVDQLDWGMILLAIAGLIIWWRKCRRWALLPLGIFLGNLLVTGLLVSDFNDTNADIHGYLLPALASLGFWIAGGLSGGVQIITAITGRMPTPWIRRGLIGAACVLAAAMALGPLFEFSPYCNLVGHHLAYDLATEATADLKPGAVVFLGGTNLDFVLRGLQYCDGWRNDLRILNRDLMPSAWYRQWVFERFPDLAAFEIPADTSRLYLDRWAVQLASAGIPVYWEFTETSMKLIPRLVPAGHLFEVSTDSAGELPPRLIYAQEEFERRSRFYGSPRQIRHDYDAQRVYVSNLYRAGIYYESRGLYGRAREMFQRALSIFSDTDSTRPGRDRLPAGRRLGAADSLLSLGQAMLRLDSVDVKQ